MTSAEMTKIAIAGGILFAAYKYGNGLIKAGAVAVAVSGEGDLAGAATGEGDCFAAAFAPAALRDLRIFSQSA